MDSQETEQILDKALNASIAKMTAGLSPAAIMAAYADWAVHLSSSPGKQAALVQKAVKKVARLTNYMTQCAAKSGSAEPCIAPLPIDKRFADEAWQKWPYNLIYQAFLFEQQWWSNATSGVRGVTQQHENVVEFATRQMLDVFSPSNYLWTNPEVLEQTKNQAGQNLVRGAQNLLEDWQRTAAGKKPGDTTGFVVGENLATSPGKVVYRNRLIELIQYAATTDKVHPEPILIVPAWIMKFYILDLSSTNSLVKYLTEQGFTVFMVSWKNPDLEDKDLDMSDYRKLGIMDAIDMVERITGIHKIHALGYCLGGTLLSIAAATMARDGDDRLQTMTLLATQVDFTEAGELMLFISESQVSFLEDMMWEQGGLDAKQMAGAFQLLRSNDLVWSRMVHDYLMGNRAEVNDMMAWNFDTTRMPYKMHSQYLRKLFLYNDLAEGRYIVDERPISVSDIRVPVFVVGTETDHVAPWQSVYKLHLLTDTDITFLLTSGGHNAGIISEPGHANRKYRIATTRKEENYTDPQSWLAKHEAQDGSWWPELSNWLVERSGEVGAVPPMGAVDKGLPILGNAPGTYVMQE